MHKKVFPSSPKGQTLLQGDIYKKFFSRAQILGTPSRGVDATSKATAEVSAKGRNEPVARNLRQHQGLLSWESVTLTYHYKELNSYTIPAGGGLRH
jgi:hypothetical protein